MKASKIKQIKKDCKKCTLTAPKFNELMDELKAWGKENVVEYSEIGQIKPTTKIEFYVSENNMIIILLARENIKYSPVIIVE